MMEDCRGLVLRHCNIFFFFILVAWGVDLTYQYVIDKNIFFGKNLGSLYGDGCCKQKQEKIN